MKTGKTTAAALAFALAAVAAIRGMETEWSGSIAYRFPDLGDFDVYDRAAGVEIQYRNWLWETYGFALSVGYEDWQAVDGKTDWGELDGGSVTVVPFGVSLIARPLRFDTAQLTLEAGLRYAMADSDLAVEAPSEELTVDVDDVWLAHLALGIDGYLSDTVTLLGGLGYQADIERASARAGRYHLMDNRFENFFLQAGARVVF
ncbi:MAG: hypothetical protein JXB04_09090 [Kiritimatiellae bacterium]|nr:hypothetical protein [Kiritimatiellia bacterium]